MKKRELLLHALRWLLLGERKNPELAPVNPVRPGPIDEFTSVASPIQVSPAAAMSTPELEFAGPAQAPAADQFPTVDDEIKGLLASSDWEEVNQGLELLVSSLGEEAIKPFGALIDATSLQVRYLEPWQAALGIRDTHEINAVAKLAELTGALTGIRSIRLNQVAYADEIKLDLSLLSGASSLEELIVNGGSVSNLTALGSLSSLRYLALVSESIDWDTEEHNGLFSQLADLHSLCLNQWPWEDLSPIGGLSKLEHLDLRGGELSSLEGLERLTSLTNLSLRDFYSLSEISEIGNLSQLRTLQLMSLGITSLEGLEGLKELIYIDLEGSDLVDVLALGSMPRLTSVRLNCGQELLGLGSLSATGSMRQLKLGNIPDYSYGESSRQRFGQREMDRLCNCWKALQTNTNKVSSLKADGADLPVVLLGVSVLETLSGQISAADFSERVDQIISHWGPELRSRAYWPKGSVDKPYSHTAPIGQWLTRAAGGSVSTETIDQIAATLSRQLPVIPQRI